MDHIKYIFETADLDQAEQWMRAGKNESKLEGIANLVFRPSWKHGYSHPKLRDLSERDHEVIAALIEIWRECVSED